MGASWKLISAAFGVSTLFVLAGTREAPRPPAQPAAAVHAPAPKPAAPLRTGHSSLPPQRAAADLPPYNLDRPVTWIGYWEWSPGGDYQPEALGVEIGDVTGDGRQDVVALIYGTMPDVHLFVVYPQKADGSFGPKISIPIKTGGFSNFIGLSIADLNLDGLQDVVLTNDRDFTVLTAAGLGRFAIKTHAYTDVTGLGASAPGALMDVNSDSYPDFVFHVDRIYGYQATLERRSQVVVHYGDGIGGSAGRSTQMIFGDHAQDLERANSLASADLDGDGFQDLVTGVEQFHYLAQIREQKIRVYYNNRQGGFRAPVDIKATAPSDGHTPITDVGIGDFNGDERLDIVGAGVSPVDSRLWFLLQSSAGKFDQPLTSVVARQIPRPLDVVDLDRDGRADILTANTNWSTLTIHLQRNGTMEMQPPRGIGQDVRTLMPSAHAAGDLDGDGCTDVAVAYSYDGLYLLYGSNCAPRRWIAMEARPSIGRNADASKPGVRRPGVERSTARAR